MVEFCKMNDNNQITVPKSIRDKFEIGNLKDEQTVLLEVDFIRVIKPTETKRGGK